MRTQKKTAADPALTNAKPKPAYPSRIAAALAAAYGVPWEGLQASATELHDAERRQYPEPHVAN